MGRGLARPAMGGRIVCASRHPPRQIESLEAWGLGGLEAWRNRKMAFFVKVGAEG